MQNEPDNTLKPLDNMVDVFGLFSSNIELAGILNVGHSTVSEMKRRESIPPQYWPPIVSEARARGRGDLTLEKFVELAKRRARDGKARQPEPAE